MAEIFVESIFFEKLSEKTGIPIENLHNIIECKKDDIFLRKKSKDNTDGADEILVILTARSLGMKSHSIRKTHLEDSLWLSKIRLRDIDGMVESMNDYITVVGVIGSLARHYDLTPLGLQRGMEILKSISE